jgi:integrase
VVVREGSRADKIRAGRNRRQAERALRKFAVAVDEGEYERQLNIAFADWADRWLESLERKATTVRSYAPTMAYGKEVFGRKPVRHLRTQDVAAFNQLLRGREISASTRAKHFRVLGACLQSAQRHGYAGRNPARDLPMSERPRPERKEAAYFENAEIPRLFTEVPDGLVKTLFIVALKTGMRQGELLALSWGDVDLGNAVVRVRRSYTDGHVSTPKNHERRDVDLTQDLVELLGTWWGECGRPTSGEVLVFPGESRSGHLSGSNLLRRHLYPAMSRAGLARAGQSGELRVFHSFRHASTLRPRRKSTRNSGGSFEPRESIRVDWDELERANGRDEIHRVDIGYGRERRRALLVWDEHQAVVATTKANGGVPRTSTYDKHASNRMRYRRVAPRLESRSSFAPW